MIGKPVIGNEAGPGIAEDYRRFAAGQAYGRSPLYEQFARGVADDAELLSFLADLPPDKRQPNLLFAAVRYLAGVQPGYRSFRAVVLDRRAEVTATMLARRTQTNEPARCATLLPALASLRQPLALLEVGASAGLCLLPDRYGYDYGSCRIDGCPGAPVLTCRYTGPVPLPVRPLEVVWRAGIDLNPLDVTDDDDARWLSCLVWPGEGDRAERLAAAIDLARRDPPPLVRGDLAEQLAETAAGAPAEATLVVFHSAVLVYVSPARRAEFARAVASLGAVWFSQEHPQALSELPGSPRDLPVLEPGVSAFLLARDGQEALAYADSHGTWIRWLALATIRTGSCRRLAVLIWSEVLLPGTAAPRAPRGPSKTEQRRRRRARLDPDLWPDSPARLLLANAAQSPVQGSRVLRSSRTIRPHSPHTSQKSGPNGT